MQRQRCSYGNYILQQQSLNMAQEPTKNYSTSLHHEPGQPEETRQMQNNDTMWLPVLRFRSSN